MLLKTWDRGRWGGWGGWGCGLYGGVGWGGGGMVVGWGSVGVSGEGCCGDEGRVGGSMGDGVLSGW